MMEMEARFGEAYRAYPEESSPLDRHDTARIDATHVSSDELALLDRGLGHVHHQLGCR